jgi:elongation factor 1-beta
LKDLNVFLQSRSYIVGFSASAADAQLFTAIGGEPDASKFPNVARFYKHIASLSAEARKALPSVIGGVAVGGAVAAAAKAPAAPAKKANDDEDVDLFGDDADAKPAAAAEKPKVDEKKKKEKPVARSICVYEVKPMSAGTDPKAMEAALRSIVMDGLKWSETFEVIEIGYGVKKIMVQFVCEDDKVDLTDLEERMLAFKGTELDEDSGEVEDLIQSVDQ